MEVIRDRKARTIKLCQDAYIKRILTQFGMDECKVATNPEMVGDLFTPPAGSDLTLLNDKELTLYQSINGSILYAAITTRIDLAHIVNELIRFNQSATQFHLKAAKHVLRYLAGTVNYGLFFRPFESDSNIPTVDIYSDSNWGGDTETRKSTSGVLVRFNGNLISWKSKRQDVVALSSTEAEYIALTEATTEAKWIQSWIKNVFKEDITVQLWCDNKSAIALSKNDTYHQRTKHIDIRYHFIREQIRLGNVTINWISTHEQQADLLTKLVATKQFITLRDQLLTAS
jgi:ribonuclease HI